MKITEKWLSKHDACAEAIEWVKTQKNRDEITLINKAMKINHFDWANWYIARRLNKARKVRYVIFAARQVLHISEDLDPNDNRPRIAFEAAEKYIKETKASAEWAAERAAWAAWAAWALESAASAAWEARKNLEIKIIKYGIKLIKEKQSAEKRMSSRLSV